MAKFEMLQYINSGSILITKDALIHGYGMSDVGAKLTLRKLTETGNLLRVGVDRYIVVANIRHMDPFILATLVAPESYISLYSVLDRNIVKQAYKDLFCISAKRYRKNIVDLLGIKINIFYSNISQDFGIYIDVNNVRTADNERALLDLIYMRHTSHLPILSELYLKGHINEAKVETYLKKYPDFVSNFYHNKLQTYEK